MGAAAYNRGSRLVAREADERLRVVRRRNRELLRENEVLRSNSDHLSSENASLARQVESMAMRIESLAEELAKPEDVRLREVLDALDGRAVIVDGLSARVGHLLDEMDEWIGRAGEAERAVEAAQRRLACVADDMTEHAYQELASALEAPPRVADRTTEEADERIRAVLKLLEENGCDCPCDHHPDERSDDCEVCLACRIEEAVRK